MKLSNYPQLSDYHIENLTKHRDVLIQIAKSERGFNMDIYIADADEYTKTNICGSAACSLGYAPETLNMSMEEINQFRHWIGIDFNEIGEKYFGISNSNDPWDFLFSADWYPIDNSIEGAIARISFVLDNQIISSNYVETNYSFYLPKI